MKLLFGFYGWKFIAEIFCGLLLVFSFIGEKQLSHFYSILLTADIVIVMFSVFCALWCKFYEKQN